MYRRIYNETEYKDGVRITPERDMSAYVFNKMVVGDFVAALTLVTDGPIRGGFVTIGGGYPGEILSFTESGDILTTAGTLIGSYTDAPTEIAVAFRVETKHFDVYINGEMKVEDYAPPKRVTSDKCVAIELRLASEGATVDVSRITVYPAYCESDLYAIRYPDAKPHVYDKKVVLTDRTTIPTEENEIELLLGCSTVHLRSGVVYSFGKRSIISPLPYRDGEKIMVSVDAATALTPTRVTKNTDSITFTCDKRNKCVTLPTVKSDLGEYIDLRALASGLGLYITEDETTVHYGTVVLSKPPFVFPEDMKARQALNNFCFFERPDKETLWQDYSASPLTGKHPRLMLDSDGFERLKTEVKENPVKARWYKTLLSYADEISAAPTLTYEIRDGVRLMYVSVDCTDYATVLCMAYRLSGNEKYLEAAKRNLLSVAAMPDWNPSHHIDVGIMAFGVAIAYDWLYEFLTEDERHAVERGAYNNCLYTVNAAIEDKNTAYGTVLMNNNHNVLVNHGNVAVCLAFTDVYPKECTKVLADILRAFECFSDKFAPDGQYYEGPHYSALAIEAEVRMLSVIKSVLGKLYSLDKTHGYSEAWKYLIDMQSDVSAYNFADGNPGRVSSQGLFWMYDHYGIKGLKDALADDFFYTPKRRAVAECLAFYSTKEESERTTIPLDAYYKTEEIVTMHSSFDKGQTFVGIKAGDTVYDHSHLDSASFVYDSMGSRWAADMGADSYNLPDYWDSRAKRWKIFNLSAEAHNNLVINPSDKPGFVLYSSAPITRVESCDSGALAEVDTTALHGTRVTKSTRGFIFTDSRRSLVYRDEVSLSALSEVHSMIYTPQLPELTENGFLLTDKLDPTKKVIVEVISNKPFTHGIEPAVTLPGGPVLEGQSKNEGYRRLFIRFNADGNLNVTVKLTPVGIDSTDVCAYDLPVSSWSLDILKKLG